MVEAVGRAGVTNQVGLVLRGVAVVQPAALPRRATRERPGDGRRLPRRPVHPHPGPVRLDLAGATRPRPAPARCSSTPSTTSTSSSGWPGPIVDVTGRSANFHEIDGIEDLAVANLALASGAVATLTSVWHDILSRPSLRRVEVFCERALYVLEGDVLGPVRWTLDDGDAGLGRGRRARGHAARPRDPAPQPGRRRSSRRSRPGRRPVPTSPRRCGPTCSTEAIYRSASDAMGPGSVIAVPEGLPGIDWV